MKISPELLQQCYLHGQETYPEEACGLISGPIGTPELQSIHRMDNVMDRYHQESPETFPRTNKDAYMICPRAQRTLEKMLKQQQQCIKVIYHSHPDVGAYFSEKDQEDALWNGEPRYPGVHYLVCAITDGKPDEAIWVQYNDTSKHFDIQKLGEPTSTPS